MNRPIATIALANDQKILISRIKSKCPWLTKGSIRIARNCYQVILSVGDRVLKTTTFTDTERLGMALDRAFPGQITLQICTTCGKIYGGYSGGLPKFIWSHGYCSESCIPSNMQE